MNLSWTSLPEYAVTDAILAIWTLFHISVAAGYMTVSDAFYKKPLLQMHYNIVKPLYSNPLIIPIGNLILFAIVASLCYYAASHPDDGRATLRAVIAVNTWASSMFLQRMSTTLVKLGVNYVMKVEKDIETHDIQTWKPPPTWISLLLAPMNLLLRPEIQGEENIPTDHGALYVMNHSLFGIEMGPFVATIYRLKQVFPRALGDFIHFGQIHGELIRYVGGVAGSRDNVDVLMRADQNVLVYPGGGHEILKSTAVPNYTLLWKQRLGFARVAIQHGYPIVPCCCVGTEDMFHRVFDIDLGFIRRGLKLPVIQPVFPHQIQRVYFWVGEPIPTAQYNGDYENTEFAQEVRDKVKAAVEAGIREMQEKQAIDPNRFLMDHIANIGKGLIASVFGGSSTETIQVDKEERAPESKKID